MINRVRKATFAIAAGLIMAADATALPTEVGTFAGVDSVGNVSSLIDFNASLKFECDQGMQSAGGLAVTAACGAISGSWYFTAGPVGSNLHYSLYVGDGFLLFSDDMIYDMNNPASWSSGAAEVSSITFWWTGDSSDTGSMPGGDLADIPEPNTLALLGLGLIGLGVAWRRR